MHVLMLSDAEYGGGAAIAASRLGAALCAHGVRLTRLVRVANGKGGPWVTRVFPPHQEPGILTRVAGKLKLGADGYTWRASNTNRQLECELRELRPDVINVHNLHWDQGEGWAPAMAGICAEHAPTVWTMHDMWSFTGRCAYAYDCRKFLTGCGEDCPTACEYPEVAPHRIRLAWETRVAMYRRYPEMAAACASHWLGREAASGMWRGHRVEMIPYGLPLRVYQPMDAAAAREALGIQANGPVLLIAAQNWTTRAKGGAYLVEALRAMQTRPVTVLVMGAGSLPDVGDGVHVRPLGYIDDEAKKVVAYSAADLFIHPAIAEVFGQVLTEAMACGTPSVAFPIGGIPEIVRPGRTGWLADKVGGASLAVAIDQAISQLGEGLDLRAECRRVAVAEYGDELYAWRYLSLFDEVRRARGRMPHTRLQVQSVGE